MPATGKFRVLEIGDSLGIDLGGGLSTQLEKAKRFKLIQKGKSETGLANAWFYNWPHHLRGLLAEYHPRLLVVFLGGNDEQPMVVKGSAAPFNTLAWRTQYAVNVASMMKDATKVGCSVLWVGMPIMDPNGYRQGIQVINGIFSKVAKTVSGATYLSTWDYLATPKGQFEFAAPINNGKRQFIRTMDGIHLTAIGQSVLATYIVNEMHLLYGLPVKPAYPEVITK